ncbi:pyruvate formate-lyase-activating enzyme, putative [Plesiocystis pacifica SIR-1]|uniref:Pyruvate formate-lyase-activating enzyme, putative n=1 Tax=Plesiocystis pacifica SIR-1 TaxID=391625 RepID=A6G8C7_9BACT|nr:glycyl-radical enzyme activating protein [Plesiocystis pacifica]EDM77837.1 pyruvate formate-lyase-activating enzyme, putative [Plesiocystis pacifica SIR-1]
MASEGLVFDVQRFCVHDGPGIRTVVFFKGCALNCVWCQNPEAQGNAPELAYYAERCARIPGCSACVGVCPEGALGLGVEGRVDWSKCTGCGACVDACPAQALTQVGAHVDADALLTTLLRDRPFFESSGGGVTFSGGEPVLHEAFLLELLPRLGEAGISRCIETAGAYPFARLEALLPHLERVLYDVKHVDGGRHLELCGRDNATILANLERLLERAPEHGVAVEVRTPVVPGLNDGANVEATAKRLLTMGVSALTLLPYNHLWEAKLPRLSRARAPLGIGPQTRAYYAGLLETFAEAGLRAHLIDEPEPEPEPEAVA